MATELHSDQAQPSTNTNDQKTEYKQLEEDAETIELKEFIHKYKLQNIGQSLITEGITIEFLLSLSDDEIGEIAASLTTNCIQQKKLKFAINKMKTNNSSNQIKPIEATANSAELKLNEDSLEFDDKLDVNPRGIFASQLVNINAVKLNADRTVAEYGTPGHLILYGTQICDGERIYKWKIKVGWTENKGRSIQLGVVNRHSDATKAVSACWIDGSYVLFSHSGEYQGSKLVNDETYILGGNREQGRKYDVIKTGYGEILSNGDVVDIILDLKQYTMSFAINGHNQGIAVSNIKKAEYNLVINMCCIFGQQTVTILSSEVV